MGEVIALAVAGALGTLGRYALSGWTYRALGEQFPYGTLAVNVFGCLLLGFIMQLGLTSELLSRSTRSAITVGFLGAFTTFSTFGYETVRYLEEKAWLLAGLNSLANLALGLMAAWAGLRLGRLLLGGA